jgi:hypothetical protein
MTEKAQAEQQPTRAVTYPPAGPTQPIDIPRKSSKRNRDRSQRAEHSTQSAEGDSANPKQQRQILEKENVAPSSSHRQGSREDITALPMSRKLDSSPHLRPVDLERPHIPYNFRPYSNSQSSIQQEPKELVSPRPNKLRSRRSAYDSAPQSRRPSSKKQKNDRVREEEIRAMGAQTPIPKRPGEGILRRDSKKMRGSGNNRSYFSLPGDDDMESNLTSVIEQRGWEIGNLGLFSPRPAVRLSGTPQYVTPSSLASPSPIAEMIRRDKEKMPTSRDRPKMREPIGSRADDLDASDIRALMERDTKRREKKKREQQEKLEQKLRNRNGRNRGDSDKRRKEADDARKAEEAAVEAQRIRDLTTPPTAVHPALREPSSQAPEEGVGLGIAEDQTEPDVIRSTEKDTTQDEKLEDPFTDAAAGERTVTPPVEQMPGAFSPIQTPMEDPVIEEARQVQVSQTATPPFSPVSSARVPSNLSQMMNSRRASDVPLPPPPITDVRRQSDPKPDRRAGAWATFFRRGGTNLRKPGDTRSPPSDASFSNTSRESMRNQPLPPHLVDTQAQTPRRKSGTPVRTQSRFREDLPEMPVSPPDSTLPSPDVTTAAAAAATRRRDRSSAPVSVPEDTPMADIESQGGTRNDTPVSPSMRSNRMASMASIDSEGSWLASGAAKRHSTQSGVNRSIGSLNQRFTGSYEELGGDRDAEYFRRTAAGSPDAKRGNIGTSTGLRDTVPDEESDEDGDNQLETPGDPIAVQESVRRQPTLIHRDPRVKSREGLLTEFSAGGAETPEPTSAEPTSAGTGRGSLMGFEPDEPEPLLERASSVEYGKRHARQISSGSARLVGVPSPRVPASPEEPLPTSQPSSQ